MNFVRMSRGSCGHPTGGLAVVHVGYYLCPACAAKRWFESNAGLICEHAKRALSERRLAESVALCLMACACGANGCGPCRCGDRVEAVR